MLSLVGLALNDLRQALEALHEGGHGCQDPACFVCELANEAGFLVPLFTSALGIKSSAEADVRRRRGVNRGQLLRLLRL